MYSIQEKITAHRELVEKLAQRHAQLLQEVKSVELQYTATNARLALLEEMQKEEGNGTIGSELPSQGDGETHEILNRREGKDQLPVHADEHPEVPRE